MQKSTYFLLISGIGFFLDRTLKWYALSLPTDRAVFSFGPGLNFGHYLNPALFFFPAWRFIPYLALAVLITLIVFLIIRVQTNRLQPTTYPLIPILLGGASNVFDRFVYKGVIDYVNILGFATINLADILILTGLIFTLTQSYDQRR